jgi:N utilization substance protein A
VKLFEMEVPEIYDGTVQIRGCVREAGERAKVAVVSREKDVDPVGACVGMKGTRVQSIIREVRGEKIDIVEWQDDPLQFVEKALSPAKISRVTIVDEEQRIMEVVVEDKQLSLAIGKKGQNVRLAAKLVGWRIDIKSEEEKRQEVEAEMARMARIVDELRSLEGIGEKTVQSLIDAGVQGLGHILEMTPEDLTTIEGLGPKTAEKIQAAAAEAKVAWDRYDEEEAARLAAEQGALETEAAPEEEAAPGGEEAAAGGEEAPENESETGDAETVAPAEDEQASPPEEATAAAGGTGSSSEAQEGEPDAER